MNDDLRIRAVIKGRLDVVDPSSALPAATLHRAKRRRAKVMAAASLGAVASVALVFIGAQVIQEPPLNVAPAPVTTPAPEDPSPPGDTKPDRNAPPPVTIRSLDQSIELTAWSYCFGNRCVSGAPPPQPAHVGSPDEVLVEFPLEDWSFDAFFTPAGERCGRVQQVPVEEAGDGGLVLQPPGYAGAYDVTLFGRGDGDLAVTFRWTTPEDGPLPEPEARTAIISGSPRNPHSYGIELAIDNLAETPGEASATITVEADGGESLTFEAQEERSLCRQGSLYWNGPDRMGREASELGEGPFRYRVEVWLDGKRYVAEAIWPDDEIRGNEPSVRLEFRPALPALR